MACFLLILAPFLLPQYAIRQTRMIVRLVRLLRHPASTAQFGLPANYVTSLCYWPGLMLLFTFLVVSEARSYDGTNLFILMTFSPYGAAFALCSWVAMTLWFRSIIRHELAIYRNPIALVPVVILALICLNYAAVTAVFVPALLGVSSFVGGNSIWGLVLMALVLLLFYIPATSFLSFVLLVIHVAQVRAAKTWETYIPPEEEEIP